ncbi:PepSY-like domain-containing protein [Pinibacter soli]|uniref:PepSY-like domain-containing protein n=1 Tax=Pinibacter soli TaxID=3044211 RepID=A0ABT6RFJ6_9BACT|nr:PepSY-like domain-containing protein [Pinibacter soli]MDI3321338.1 PepSY-like domain-containing protein [Pinibacter soli]
MRLTILSFFAACMLLVTNLCSAQVVNIPDKAKEGFAKKYPNATDVKWSNNVSNYTAKFKQNDKPYIAHYNIDGSWDNTETEIDKSDLSKDVNEAFTKSRFSDWKVLSTDFVEDSKGQSLYRFNLKNGIEKKYLYFDKTGKEIKANSGL